MKLLTPALAVQSVPRSVEFYVNALGFTHDGSLESPDGVVVHGSVSRGAAMIMFGPMPLPPGQEPGTGIEIYLNVEDNVDIDAAFAHAVASGATVVQEPADQFWGDRNWAILDPDGYRLVVGKQMKSLTMDEMSEAMAEAVPV